MKSQLVIFISCLLYTGQANCQPLAQAQSQRLTEVSFQRYSESWSWSQRPWIARNDARFLKAAAQVDRKRLVAQVKAGVSPLNILTPFKQRVIDHPGNAVIAYQWALAADYVQQAVAPGERITVWRGVYALLHHIQMPDYYTVDQPWHDMANAGQLPKPPQSYVFDRLMFLVAVNDGKYPYSAIPQANALAERLLQRNPRDRRVALAQIEMLENSGQGSDNKWPILAVSKASSLVKHNPKEPALLITLARAYEFAWDGWKSPTYGQYELATYRKYLNKVPANDPYRSWVNQQIEGVIRAQKRYTKYKTKKEWLASLGYK